MDSMQNICLNYIRCHFLKSKEVDTTSTVTTTKHSANINAVTFDYENIENSNSNVGMCKGFDWLVQYYH